MTQIYNGRIEEFNFNFDTWEGQVNLPQRILEDRTPKYMNGSFYTWSQYRSQPSLITTVTVLSADDANTMQTTIYNSIGYVVSAELYRNRRMESFWWKVLDASVSIHECKSTIENGTSQVIVQWTVEISNKAIANPTVQFN